MLTVLSVIDIHEQKLLLNVLATKFQFSLACQSSKVHFQRGRRTTQKMIIENDKLLRLKN